VPMNEKAAGGLLENISKVKQLQVPNGYRRMGRARQEETLRPILRGRHKRIIRKRGGGGGSMGEGSVEVDSPGFLRS